ncbi:hypothetical protein AN958_02660 [Leucoagaricus sp. SymC.cos]|nr:hypothetical protein AN958_02660 [Leucoagaricus sp. SymC.cos]
MTSKATCPYCYQTTADRNVFLMPSPQSSADEIAHIRAEMRCIDNPLFKPHEERAALLRCLNAVRSSTRVLFPEILSLIFQHASPAPDFFLEEGNVWPEHEPNPSFHLVVGSVSSLWREIVDSTPNLWTSIRVKTRSVQHTRRWTVFLLKSFEKSRSLPIDIAFLRIGSSWQDSNHLFSSEVDEVLLKNCHRIRSLRLSHSIPLKWISTIPGLTGLRDLSIQSSQFIPHLSLLSNSLLNRLRVETPIRPLFLPTIPTSLTVLRLSHVPIDLCMQFLVNFRELVEFRCYYPAPLDHDHTTSVLFNQISLDKLEVFQWTFLPEPFDSLDHLILTRFEFPRLKTLSFVELLGAFHQYDEAVLTDFLRRLPLTLKDLEFYGIEHLSFLRDRLIPHIRKETQVISIFLRRCSESFLCDILSGLLRTNGGPIPLLHLNKILVESCMTNTEQAKVSDSLRRLTGRYLVEVLQQRCDVTDQFTFAVAFVSCLDWGQDTVDDLRRLVDEKGLGLRVLHQGVDILSDDDQDTSFAA